MAASLQRKAFWGMVWNFAESFSLQIIQFIIGIFMARILQPSDYGMVGMLSIFLTISNMLITSGFYRALIQKKDRTAIDYSTVFYFNIVVGIILYLVLFFSSPYIALFYNVPILEDLTKVIAIPLILNSLSQVQNAKFAIEMNFKMLSKISIITAIITGISSLYMAYSGFGVWSIAYSSVIGESSRCILLWFFANWTPLWKFSWKSFREMFSFGSKMFASGLLESIYNNLYTLIIGKKFAATELGYYTRANGYAQLPVATFNNALSKVTFPMFCEVQKDDERMILLYHKLLRFTAFIIFPIMMLFIVLARPLILFMITDKWESCVILLQILCLSYVWNPVQIVNINLLQAKGRADVTLKIDILKKRYRSVSFMSYYSFRGCCDVYRADSRFFDKYFNKYLFYQENNAYRNIITSKRFMSSIALFSFYDDYNIFCNIIDPSKWAEDICGRSSRHCHLFFCRIFI